MQLLEHEMGINKFSIYDSFGSKEVLFEESIKCYTQQLSVLINRLKKSNKGILAIKQYFIDFAAFSSDNDTPMGCLITNTANEMIHSCSDSVKQLISSFTSEVRSAFAQKLADSNQYSIAEIEGIADYLLVAKAGFSSATKMFSEKQVENYLHHIFKHI